MNENETVISIKQAFQNPKNYGLADYTHNDYSWEIVGMKTEDKIQH